MLQVPCNSVTVILAEYWWDQWDQWLSHFLPQLPSSRSKDLEGNLGTLREAARWQESSGSPKKPLSQCGSTFRHSALSTASTFYHNHLVTPTTPAPGSGFAHFPNSLKPSFSYKQVQNLFWGFLGACVARNTKKVKSFLLNLPPS